MYKTNQLNGVADMLPVIVVSIICTVLAVFAHIGVMTALLYIGYTPLTASLAGAFAGININYVLQIELTLKGGCYLPFFTTVLVELVYLILSGILFFLFNRLLNFNALSAQIFTIGVVFILVWQLFFRN